jgi:long-chain acyl-CoA synthetase
MNLAEIIEAHPSDAVALIDPATRRTYGELRARVGCMRGALQANGVAAGDRVALIGENSVELIEAYLAVLGVGAIAVMLNRNNPESATEAELVAVGATQVLVGPGGAFVGDVPSLSTDDLVSAASVPIVHCDDDDIAALLFTSGTAGTPKAAMLSHGNLRSNIEQAMHVADSVRPTDVLLAVLPIDHIYGLNAIVGETLLVGASAVLVPRFDPTATLALIRAERVTVVPGVPAMFQAWAEHATAE